MAAGQLIISPGCGDNVAELLTRQESTHYRQYWSNGSRCERMSNVNVVGTVLKMYSFEGLGRIRIIYLFRYDLVTWWSIPQ